MTRRAIQRIPPFVLVLLAACGGQTAAPAGTGNTGGTSAGGGTTAGGGTLAAGGSGGSETGGSGGSFGTDASACLSYGYGCDGVTPCCSDSKPCTVGCSCGVAPSCVAVGGPCGPGYCSGCCSGQCVGSTCVGPFACKASVATYCAANPCITTWPTDPTAFCPLLTAGSPQIGTCAGFSTATAQGVDTARVYFFDGSTGVLVAIVAWFNGYGTCVAGPSTFPNSTCGFGTPIDCNDAGAPSDAGSD